VWQDRKFQEDQSSGSELNEESTNAVKVKFTLEEATKAQKGVEVQLYSFFNNYTRWGWVINVTPRHLTPWKGTRYPLHCTEGWVDTWPVLAGTENLTPTRF